jgi:hypothetical protein
MLGFFEEGAHVEDGPVRLALLFPPLQKFSPPIVESLSHGVEDHCEVSVGFILIFDCLGELDLLVLRQLIELLSKG